MERRGFTLIELLVVIAIIGILAVIVIINVSKAKDKAVEAKTKSDLISVLRAGQIFLATGGDINAIADFDNPQLMDDADVRQLTDGTAVLLQTAPVQPGAWGKFEWFDPVYVSDNWGFGPTLMFKGRNGIAIGSPDITCFLDPTNASGGGSRCE